MMLKRLGKSIAIVLPLGVATALAQGAPPLVTLTPIEQGFRIISTGALGNCIACHANNAALIQRQATAFHADITTCSPCHLEHSGALAPTRMDHSALARIGLSQLEQVDASDPQSRRIRQLMNGNKTLSSNENVTAAEAILKCASCHAVKDRHQGYFGNECASCHAVAKWTIPEFRHPSPNSQECDQCHKAPPSHSMMHFKMISAAVAKQPSAKVNECYKCHQTTVWNDIRGVGWYKHH